MLGQIIDLLTKKDDERRRVSFLLFKLIFTITITAKLYRYIYGTDDITAIINDFKSFTVFFIHGKAIGLFILFYFVWFISYELTSFILSLFGIWLSNLFYEIVNEFIENRQQITTEISEDKILQNCTKIYIWILNAVDIIEIKKNSIKPRIYFYKFYQYLLDIKNEKRTVDNKEFSDTIALIIQFVVIYFLLDFDFISYPLWMDIFITFILLCLFFISLLAYVLSILVDIKHDRLLKLTEELKNDFEKQHSSQ